ncbi:MAG: glycosyltransferase family 2 protein, partial [Thermosulfidibacteraceae bacterium]
NSATQKNWAIPQASNEWVMIVDADERVTPELRDEILEELRNPRYDGYYIGRRNFFLGFPLDHGGWSPKEDRNIRLFRKSVSRYEDKEVHADVVVNGKVGSLRNYLIHYTYRSLQDYFRKFDRYTTWAAKDIVKAGKKPNFFNLVLRPMGDFIKFYILKLGFLDGLPGLIIALLSSYYVVVKYVKAWELYLKEGKE